jgi:hypothetical protein
MHRIHSVAPRGTAAARPKRYDLLAGIELGPARAGVLAWESGSPVARLNLVPQIVQSGVSGPSILGGSGSRSAIGHEPRDDLRLWIASAV